MCTFRPAQKKIRAQIPHPRSGHLVIVGELPHDRHEDSERGQGSTQNSQKGSFEGRKAATRSIFLERNLSSSKDGQIWASRKREQRRKRGTEPSRSAAESPLRAFCSPSVTRAHTLPRRGSRLLTKLAYSLAAAEEERASERDHLRLSNHREEKERESFVPDWTHYFSGKARE